jgi:hypothetical protein
MLLYLLSIVDTTLTKGTGSRKAINLEYGLLDSRKQLSQNLPSRNGNLKLNLEKPLGPHRNTHPPPGVFVGLCDGVG